MIVYEATKQLFVEDVVQDRIEENIDRKFYEKMGYHTSQSERNAWNNSMQYMMKVLIDNNIPQNVGIAIEYKIPNTSKRVDFIITGKDGKLKNTAIIVELKWDKTAETAIQQIKSKNYIESLKDYRGKVVIVGISYENNAAAENNYKKHHCKIEVVEM